MILLNLVGFVAAVTAGPAPFPVQLMDEVSGRNVTVSIDGSVETTFAGKLGFRDANHEWMSVCADVRSPVRQGQIFGVQALSSAKYGGAVARAGNIVARYFSEAQTPDQCAGLQLAVWKALEDGTEWADFGSGHFRARASIAVITLAQDYYKAINIPGNATFLLTSGGGGAQGSSGQGGGGTAGSGQDGGGGGGQSQLSG